MMVKRKNNALDATPGHRLLVVSNRLPVSIRKDESGHLTAVPSSGGLVSALTPILSEYGGIWVNCFHPFCSGQVARLMMVKQMIETMQKKGGVWFATGAEVANHVQTLIQQRKYTPRTDHLPFYKGKLAELQPNYWKMG